MQALSLRQFRNGPLDLARPRPVGLNILSCAQSSLIAGRSECEDAGPVG